MKLRENSLEVLVADERIVLLTHANLDDLKARATKSPRGRARICAHRSADDSLHEMMIALCHGCYIRPHRHLAKVESYHMLQGRMDIVMFDDAGSVIETVHLGAPGSDDPFFYRNDAAGFHTVLVRSDFAVFHETTNGPFRPEETIPAPWAPDEADLSGAAIFLAHLGDAAR
jgi:cupin fold WbuC family metalloprotein